MKITLHYKGTPIECVEATKLHTIWDVISRDYDDAYTFSDVYEFSDAMGFILSEILVNRNIPWHELAIEQDESALLIKFLHLWINKLEGRE